MRVYRFGGDVKGAELQKPASKKDKPASTPPPTENIEKLPLALDKPVADQTRIGNALDYVMQDTAGQPLAGIVLLSDGGQNMGDDPNLAAQRAADGQGADLHHWLRRPDAPRDVAITSLLADEVVRKGDEVVVSVSIRQRGFTGRTVPLTLRMGDRVLKKENVTLAKEGEKQELNLSFTPDKPGAQTLVVEIPGLEGEISLSNNRKSWPIRVIDKKLKILYVEGKPRWEFRFLKNAILRDKTTLFSCILAGRGPVAGRRGQRADLRLPQGPQERSSSTTSSSSATCRATSSPPRT